ncbi:hypothetical protein A2U01_0067560 [Trifolium medium]|uniref:Uncharacterized protein n=1 Tax=Trifolium medium TaxID=97028 RepID=A0A392SEF2_9FABA|nr:hypothetical protein [Trifolium medium]
MRMKRKRRQQLEAVLKWTHSRPMIVVPDEGSRPDEQWWNSDCDKQDCQGECGCITDDHPKLTYPPE